MKTSRQVLTTVYTTRLLYARPCNKIDRRDVYYAWQRRQELYLNFSKKLLYFFSRNLLQKHI